MALRPASGHAVASERQCLPPHADRAVRRPASPAQSAAARLAGKRRNVAGAARGRWRGLPSAAGRRALAQSGVAARRWRLAAHVHTHRHLPQCCQQTSGLSLCCTIAVKTCHILSTIRSSVNHVLHFRAYSPLTSNGTASFSLNRVGLCIILCKIAAIKVIGDVANIIANIIVPQLPPQ